MHYNTIQMKALFHCYILLIPLIFLGCSGAKKTVASKSGVAFSKSNSMSDILEQAEKTNKLVFVDIVTEWCLPCKMMEKDVFSDPQIADFMNKNFINYKVDAEKGNGPVLSLVYEVQAFPTLLFVDSKGDVIVKKVGAAYHSELMEMARTALASNELP